METCKWGHPRTPDNLYKNKDCKICAKRRVKESREKDPERFREYKRAAYRKDPAKVLEQSAARRLALKTRVMAGYGGKCACCNESLLAFLTIDHISGDGGGRKRRSHSVLWRQLIREGFPPEYQCLCFNCNIAKHNSGQNQCPHVRS
jgi:hypothetical protein